MAAPDAAAMAPFALPLRREADAVIAMTDNDVIDETRRMENQLEEAEEWLEAVAAWEEAGRPRALSAAPSKAGGSTR